MSRRVSLFMLFSITVPFGQTSFADELATYELVFKDHAAAPAEIHVPRGKPFFVHVKNAGADNDEFEMLIPPVERAVPAGGETRVLVRPLGHRRDRSLRRKGICRGPITARSRDNLPNPLMGSNPYIPVNSPAVGEKVRSGFLNARLQRFRLVEVEHVPEVKQKQQTRMGATEEKQIHQNRTGAPDERNSARTGAAEGGKSSTRTGAAEERNNMERRGTAENRGQPKVIGNVKTSPERATPVTDLLMRNGRRENVNVEINVGTRIPDSVTIYPLPPAVLSIAPEYRGYDYFVESDQVVFVSPDTHEIVGSIEYEGRAAANEGTRVAGARPCPSEN